MDIQSVAGNMTYIGLSAYPMLNSVIKYLTGLKLYRSNEYTLGMNYFCCYREGNAYDSDILRVYKIMMRLKRYSHK